MNYCRLIVLLMLSAFLPSVARGDEATGSNATSLTSTAETASIEELYRKQGNIPPRIEKLTSEKEASILKDVRVAEGFETTVFAAPPAVNYPVFVAADVDGTLYVSSDGNGSLGRSPQRGRVIRLRDLDGDGRADETKIFCEVDAPRGLVWDHDRLFLMHPPHLSAYIDHNGDGVADEEKILVKNLAFGYDKRPADHTTNGVSIGLDGWLYIAGGDFGFMDAEGTDGRRLTHRGGGVIRVRPDGSDLQLYSTGTRNILEVAISPSMDLFARDNTNDGGGWDVRLHHFTGSDDHGYPRLYKNFSNECVAPLADYGGGSGCGAVYIDEPGFDKWNNAPFTADWGTGALYRHSVRSKGATFEEFSAPESFIKMTRPTDADVDGLSRVFCASWRGATFNWEGPDVGYIVCVKPKNFKPEPLPMWSSLNDVELMNLLSSSSYRRRLEAQREMIRRGKIEMADPSTRIASNRNEFRNLAERLQTDAKDEETIAALAHLDPVIVHIAVRTLAKRGIAEKCLASFDKDPTVRANVLRALAMMHTPEVVHGLAERLSSQNEPEVRRLILAALCRLYYQEGTWMGDSWGTRPDTRGPYYQPTSWSETERIDALLKSELASASPHEAGFLIGAMNQNRIQSDEALDRILKLAAEDESLIDEAVYQLSVAGNVPDDAVSLLASAVRNPSTTSTTLSQAVIALSRLENHDAVESALTGLAQLQRRSGAGKEIDSARDAFMNSRLLQNAIGLVCKLAEQNNAEVAFWADAAILFVASKKDVSPEAVENAKQASELAWTIPERQIRFMRAAAEIKNHSIDDQIRKAIHDENPRIAEAATEAAKKLRLADSKADKTPKIATLSVEVAIERAVKGKGEIGRGEQLFTKANCSACHTVSKDAKQQGPYLGNIAQTYKRQQLAEAILQPNKTIAQGFATTSILTVDGLVVTGFVTNETADTVVVRDSQAKEHVFSKDDVETRKILPTSAMPDGLLNEYTTGDLSSILDFIQSLVTH